MGTDVFIEVLGDYLRASQIEAVSEIVIPICGTSARYQFKVQVRGVTWVYERDVKEILTRARDTILRYLPL